MSRYSKRTQAGLTRDADLPRATVAEIVDHMHHQGLVRFTTSANTGSVRVALTPLGTDVLNALSPRPSLKENREADQKRSATDKSD
jgi:DNA-binding IclR family transcriptional regulator